MAGYDCEFVESVGVEYKCRKCFKVAREATLTSCCGENFCEACITDITHKEELCPHCGKRDIQFLKHVKYQQFICSFQVFCSMKERGCNWIGRLDQLVTHLNSCEYVDTICPLGCGTTIPKNKLEEHANDWCVKREHFCQYCSFKASFEEIEGQHIPVCKYVPLQCPNRCGVTFEREDMEDHMKMCLKQEISCEFYIAGCEDRFNREDQGKHNKENILIHLSMLSRVHQKYQDATGEKLEKELAKLTNAVEKKSRELQAQEEKLKAQEETFRAQEEKLKDQETKLEGMQKKVRAQEEKLQVQEAEHLEIILDFNVIRQEVNRKVTELERMMKEHEENSRKERGLLKARNSELLKVFGIMFFIVSLIVAVTMFQAFFHSHPCWENNQQQTFNERFQNKTVILEEQIGQRHNEIFGLQHELEAITASTQRNISSLEYSLQELGNRTRNFSMFKNGFIMKKFNAKQIAGGAWTSPAMYTHVGGYKFVFHVYADGTENYWHGVYISYEMIAGEFDDNLEWPVTIGLLAQLLDVFGNAKYSVSQFVTLNQNSTKFLGVKYCGHHNAVYFLCHSEVEPFLVDDSLSFKVVATIR